MIIEAGELDRRVTILERTDKRDVDNGDLEQTYTVKVTQWGKLTALTPKMLEIARGFAPTVGHQILLRHCPQANNECKAVISQKEFWVNGVVHDPSPMPQWTILYVTLDVK